MYAHLWERSGRAACPESSHGTQYGNSGKSQQLHSSQAPFVAASWGVEKVTLLLNSFPVKPRASPLSDFEELVAGADSPVPLPGPLIEFPLDEGWTLTVR